MAVEEYYCDPCNRVEFFNSGSENHTCPQCYREMKYRDKLDDKKFLYDKDKEELTIRNGVNTMLSFMSAKSVRSVIFPASLIEIPSFCFAGAVKLEKVTIQGAIRAIGENAFIFCSSLKEIVLPEGLLRIGGCVFCDCSSLKKVTIPETMRVIGDRAFKGCASLEEIILPEGLLSIGEYTFQGCSSMKKVSIPRTIREIGNRAFENCSSLEEIVLPEGLLSIGSSAFEGCSSIKKVTIPGTTQAIGNRAFANCSSLEEITLPDGLPSIEEFAFCDCDSMKFVKLPSNLKAIGKFAFGNCSLKIVALPKSVSEIAEKAFAVSTDRAFPLSLVEAGSFAEKYVANRGYKYRVRENVEGFASSEFVYNGVLLEAEKSGKSIEISSNITVIASGAFEGYTEIERIDFPSTVVEIQSYAFAGCTGIKELTFQTGLQKIGEKAFYDTNVQEVLLPTSIESIASDAFPPKCVVSVDGEMPFYGQKLEALKKCREELVAKKERLIELKQAREAIEAQMTEFAKNRPEELDQIPIYQNQIAHIQEQISAQKREFGKRRESNASQQQTCQSELNTLKSERKKCFFLATSKKKNLDARISEKENELQAILDGAEQLLSDEAKAMALQKNELASATACLERLMALDERRRNVLQRQKLSLESTAAEIAAYTSEIATTEDKLLHEENDLEAAHSAWQAAKEKLATERKRAEIAQKLAKLLAEEERRKAEEERRKRELQKRLDEASAKKARLIKKIGKPKYQVEKLYEYIPGEAIVEERLINQCFLDMLSNQNEASRVAAYQLFVEEHSKELEQIRELNRILECAENDGIEDFGVQDAPALTCVEPPERFVTLNTYFGKVDSWKHLRHAAQKVQKGKRTKGDSKEQLFEGMGYLKFSGTSNDVLLFPYCLLVCEPDKQIRVFTYDKVKTSVKSNERDVECSGGTRLPPHGELLSERRKYLNKDGSPNMRYKNNPIVKALRFTSITILAEKKCVVFPVDTRDGAIQFVDALNQHVETLCHGIQKSIYAKVCASEEMDNIRQAITDLSIAEKKRKDCERKKAEEESQRIESERLAAQLAAEEKRKAIIQRQREINEERKRQEREKEAASRQLAKLFDDDFKGGHTVELTQSEDSPNLPIEVVGNRLISNTVFKIEIRAICNLSLDEITACFVSKTGMPISNRKKLACLSDEENITLGFVLDSGVDYTTMKECFLRLDSQNRTLGDIAFRMNISFCSDF